MDEASVHIAASARRVWSLITDVTQMGRWSPECWSCTWLDGARGLTVSARFKGRDKRGFMRWSTVSTLVVADEPSHFAFEVDHPGMRWGYRIEAARGGSNVIEYSDAIVRRGMSETLRRLKAGAEDPS